MAKEDTMDLDKEPSSSRQRAEVCNINYVGERSAVIFSAVCGKPLLTDDLPDDFFELDKSEVQQLFKELKQQRDDLENMPFRTKAQREMEENAAMLNQLKRYSQTVIRVQFPDRLVFQAVFNHSDTVQTVMDFLRLFLNAPDVQFCLYTAPPKCVLRPDVTLIDARLTPRALVYFGFDPPQDRSIFLKPSLTDSLSTINSASEAALKFKKEITEDVNKETVDNQTASTSTTSTSLKSPTSSKRGKTASNKIPKWFKK